MRDEKNEVGGRGGRERRGIYNGEEMVEEEEEKGYKVLLFVLCFRVSEVCRDGRRHEKGKRRKRRVTGDARVVVSLHPRVLRPLASPFWFSFSLVGRVHPRPFLPFYP